jgi:hypothetical protein
LPGFAGGVGLRGGGEVQAAVHPELDLTEP